MNRSHLRHVSPSTALEARLGARVAAALSAQSPDLPRDVTERLRFARSQALAAATARRQAALSSGQRPGALVLAGRSLAFAGGPASLGVGGAKGSWWQWFGGVLPVLLLLAGLHTIDRWASQEQVQAAAEVDALLLADDLPPEAYTDPGFGEFLRTLPP